MGKVELLPCTQDCKAGYSKALFILGFIAKKKVLLLNLHIYMTCYSRRYS